MGSEFRSRFRSCWRRRGRRCSISHTGIEGGNHREPRRFEWLRESRFDSEPGEIVETTKQRRAEVEVTEQDGGPREAGIRGGHSSSVSCCSEMRSGWVPGTEFATGWLPPPGDPGLSPRTAETDA